MPALPSKNHSAFFSSLRARILALALCCLLPALLIVAGIGILQNRYEHDEGKRSAARLTSLVSASQIHLAATSRRLLVEMATDPRVRGPRAECSSYLAEVLRLNPAYTNLG